MRAVHLLAAAALAMLPLLAPPRAAAVVVDGVAAVVNGEVITILELERAGRPLAEERQRAAAAPDRDRVRREAMLQVLDQLIATRLQAQRARQLGIQVSPQEVDAAIANIMEERRLTEAMLERLLAETGTTREDYRRGILDQIRLSKLVQQEIRSRVTVGEEEIAAYFAEHRGEWYRPERIRFRHLLIPVASGAPPAEIEAARVKAATIRDEARAGREFVDLLRAHDPSAVRGEEDPVSGEIARGELSAPLEEAAFSLAAGEVSEPVRTAAGFHLIQLVGRTPAVEPSLPELRDSIEQRLAEQKARARLEGWQRKLREQAIIELRY